MTFPHVTTGFPTAVNLVSTATHQFAVWWTLAGELRVGRIERGAQMWGVDHDVYEFAGAPRTALDIPVDPDDHNYPCIAVDGLGRLHLWANIHNNTLRAVRTVDAHTTDGWLATAGWVDASGDFPGVNVANTYPTPIQCADGSLWFYLRSSGAGSGAGHADSLFWTRGPTDTAWSSATMIFQGLEVPDAGGPGIPGGAAASDVDNWNAYCSNPYVEPAGHPHPGRMHMWWLWHSTGGVTRSNSLLSYGYSDDNGITWHAFDGTLLALPITPLNNPACHTGLDDTVVGYIGPIGATTVDGDGLPHALISWGDTWWARHTGSGWVQSTVAQPLAGIGHQSTGSLFRVHDALWMLKRGNPDNARRSRLWRLDGATSVVMGGVQGFAAEGFDPTADPEAYRRFGTVEVLVPDGDTPRVTVFGQHARIEVAA